MLPPCLAKSCALEGPSQAGSSSRMNASSSSTLGDVRRSVGTPRRLRCAVSTKPHCGLVSIDGSRSRSRRLSCSAPSSNHKPHGSAVAAQRSNRKGLGPATSRLSRTRLTAMPRSRASRRSSSRRVVLPLPWGPTMSPRRHSDNRRRRSDAPCGSRNAIASIRSERNGFSRAIMGVRYGGLARKTIEPGVWSRPQGAPRRRDDQFDLDPLGFWFREKHHGPEDGQIMSVVAVRHVRRFECEALATDCRWLLQQPLPPQPTVDGSNPRCMPDQLDDKPPSRPLQVPLGQTFDGLPRGTRSRRWSDKLQREVVHVANAR